MARTAGAEASLPHVPTGRSTTNLTTPVSARSAELASSDRPPEPASAPPSVRRGGVLPENPAELPGVVRRLAAPIVLENFFQSTLDMVSVAIVGRLGASAIAGLGTATQLAWVGQSAAVALAVGTTVLVARAIGRGDRADAGATVRQSLLVGGVLALVAAAVGLGLAEPLTAVFALDGAAHEIGVGALRLALGGLGAMLAMVLLGAALRGAGDGRTPMAVTGAINLLNLVLAPALVFGWFGWPELGAVGAVWATVLVRGAGAALLAAAFLRRGAAVPLRGGSWRPDPARMAEMLRLGLPSAGEQIVIALGMLVNGLMAVPLGTAVFAAQRVVFNTTNVAFLPGLGCGLAVTTLVGQAFGAGRPRAAEAAFRAASRLGLWWSVVPSIWLLVAAEWFAGLFSSDPAVIAAAAPAIRVSAFGQPIWALAMIVAGALRGAGETRFPMWAALAGMWLVRLPLSYLFGPGLGFGLAGMFVGNVLDAGVRGAICWWRLGGEHRRARLR